MGNILLPHEWYHISCRLVKERMMCPHRLMMCRHLDWIPKLSVWRDPRLLNWWFKTYTVSAFWLDFWTAGLAEFGIAGLMSSKVYTVSISWLDSWTAGLTESGIAGLMSSTVDLLAACAARLIILNADASSSMVNSWIIRWDVSPEMFWWKPHPKTGCSMGAHSLNASDKKVVSEMFI